MLDVERSLAAAQNIEVEKKACWSNALSAFLFHKEFHKGWYVEGWAVPTIKSIRLPLEHGWVELENGSVIDPTFAVLGHRNIEYFPGLKLTYEEAFSLARKGAKLPHIRSYGSGGMAYLPYQEAYWLSLQAATGKEWRKERIKPEK